MMPGQFLLDDDAQASIGSIIILITALLVAATTAGVFFEVTGQLEGDATSSESARDQVTQRVSVVAASGTVQNGSVEVVSLVVKSSSNDPIDLEDAMIQWFGPSTVQRLVWAGTETTGPTFGIEMLRNDDNTTRVLNSDEDRARITIDPGTSINATTTIGGETVDIEETGPALDSGDIVTLDIITGGTTEYRFVVPQPVPENDTIPLGS